MSRRHCWYKLHPETHAVTPVHNFGGFGQWMANAERTVARTEAYHPERGKVSVSTIFTGLDFEPLGGPPLLFETKIFGGERNGWLCRYSTWDKAVAGHEQVVQLVTGCVPQFASVRLPDDT